MIGMLGRFRTGNNDLRQSFAATRRLYRRPDLHDHLIPGRPKRILALDGGGIRSAMSIAILEKIEEVLARRHGNHHSFRLADYYDLIGGTSTGAVLAGALASRGMRAADLREIYQDIAMAAFRRGDKFDAKRFDKALRDVFGKETLSGNLTTGMAVVARQLDSDRTLVFHNNPDGPHFDDEPDRAALGYSRYGLANVIRASTARPGEFSPEQVELTREPHSAEGIFVDAGFTPFNNPAFQLFLLATRPERGFGWATGKDELLVSSVGTGSLCHEISTARQHRKASPAILAQRGLKFMIDGAEHTGELLMQMLSDPASPSQPGCEFGDFAGVRLTEDPQCTYQRYQAKLTAAAISQDLKISLSSKQLGRVRNMLDRDGFQIAYEIGQAVADLTVKDDQFPEIFDLERLTPPPSAKTAEPVPSKEETQKAPDDQGKKAKTKGKSKPLSEKKTQAATAPEAATATPSRLMLPQRDEPMRYRPGRSPRPLWKR